MRSLKFNKTNILYVLFGLFALFLIINNVYYFFRGIIYDSGNYYVNLFPEDENSKNYRVIGEVDFDSETGSYSLIKATFPSGGYITFEDYYSIDPLEFYEKVYLEDDDEIGWYVELTKQKVKDE